MASREYDPQRVRVLRELLAEAGSETPRTTEEAMARPGAMAYLRTKLTEAGRAKPDGD